MDNPPIQPSEPSKPAKAEKIARVLKLLVFSVGSLNAAIRVEFVQKVVNKVTVYSSEFGYLGVANVGDEEITVIDLHERFFKSNQNRNSSLNGYLAIVKNNLQEKFGIWVVHTPVLMEVPLSQVRTLPESYRRANTLEIASHVAVIPQETASMTLFLLDPDRMLLPTILEKKSE